MRLNQVRLNQVRLNQVRLNQSWLEIESDPPPSPWYTALGAQHTVCQCGTVREFDKVVVKPTLLMTGGPEQLVDHPFLFGHDGPTWWPQITPILATPRVPEKSLCTNRWLRHASFAFGVPLPRMFGNAQSLKPDFTAPRTSQSLAERRDGAREGGVALVLATGRVWQGCCERKSLFWRRKWGTMAVGAGIDVVVGADRLIDSDARVRVCPNVSVFVFVFVVVASRARHTQCTRTDVCSRYTYLYWPSTSSEEEYEERSRSLLPESVVCTCVPLTTRATFCPITPSLVYRLSIWCSESIILVVTRSICLVRHSACATENKAGNDGGWLACGWRCHVVIRSYTCAVFHHSL